MNETTDVIGVANCFAKMSVMSSIDFYSVVLTFCKKKVSRDLIFRGQFLLLSKFSGLIKVLTSLITEPDHLLTSSIYNSKMIIIEKNKNYKPNLNWPRHKVFCSTHIDNLYFSYHLLLLKVCNSLSHLMINHWMNAKR